MREMESVGQQWSVVVRVTAKAAARQNVEWMLLVMGARGMFPSREVTVYLGLSLEARELLFTDQKVWRAGAQSGNPLLVDLLATLYKAKAHGAMPMKKTMEFVIEFMGRCLRNQGGH